MFNRNTHIKTSEGWISKTNRDEWLPVYQRYLKLGSIKELARELGIYNETLKKYLFDIFSFLMVSKEEMYRKRDARTKENLTNKYGVDCVFKIEEVKNKIKKTLLETYGVDHNFKSKEIRENIKDTCLSRYGDKNYNNREKFIKTCIDKFGRDNYCNKSKRVETNNVRYGGKAPASSEKVRKKMKDSCLKRFGKEYALQCVDIKQKCENTCLSRYGHRYAFQDKDIINKIKGVRFGNTLLRWEKKYLKSHNYELLDKFTGIKNTDTEGHYDSWRKYYFRHKDCGNIFTDTFNNGSIICPKCYPREGIISRKEVIVSKLFTEYPTILNSRKVVSPYEIDIFLPELNIGFEYNGCYWHSSLFKKNKYHRDKTELALSKGVKLYHIWEHDNEEIVKSMVKSILGKSENRYYARKLKIKEVTYKERKLFFDANHLHGDVKSSFALGLYQEDELVSCISFRKHKEGIEIARFATKLNSSCVGGFSRLLRHSMIKIKELGYNKIITYCDRDWTPNYKDSVYYKNGFTFIKDTGCSLSYTTFNKTFSRETFQKHKLKELFPETYSKDKTADEILEENGIHSLYNSGNWKFEKFI